QNLWRASRPDEIMPISLLPVSQYSIWTLLTLFTVGGALGGLLLRAPWRPRRVPRRALGWGLLIVHAVALVQGYAALARGLRLGTGQADSRSALYFGAMLLVALLGLSLAQLACWLIAHPSRAVACL